MRPSLESLTRTQTSLRSIWPGIHSSSVSSTIANRLSIDFLAYHIWTTALWIRENVSLPPRLPLAAVRQKQQLEASGTPKSKSKPALTCTRGERCAKQRLLNGRPNFKRPGRLALTRRGRRATSHTARQARQTIRSRMQLLPATVCLLPRHLTPNERTKQRRQLKFAMRRAMCSTWRRASQLQRKQCIRVCAINALLRCRPSSARTSRPNPDQNQRLTSTPLTSDAWLRLRFGQDMAKARNRRHRLLSPHS
mmetsp:Transcript_20554/g.65598  ORF Transcript_20554/g.65598 Transcript_20554/m.65598 type:complete len:251 (+) Transcript_20554:701-1453(+)